MQITYKSKKLKLVCTNASAAIKEYGSVMAQKIHTRIDQISAATSIEELLQFKIGRCHALSHNRKGQYAMDLEHPYRLIFKVDKYGNLQVAKIEEILDYH